MPSPRRVFVLALVLACWALGAPPASAAEPIPSARVVFLIPSDLAEPPGVDDRLTAAVEAAERFLLGEMRRVGYPPAAARLFPRRADGRAEVIRVRGDAPAADRKYLDPAIRFEAVDRARRAAGLAGTGAGGDAWWVFVYLGAPPTRFADWRGRGDPVDGGIAVVNYDSSPGTIRADLGLAVGFNRLFALKGAVHEFGHALGLPHEGPDPALGLGNSLMGPNNDVYESRRLPKPDLVYLTPASAAMLWKHPLLSGSTGGRARRPEGLKLAAYKATYSRPADRVTVRGRVASNPLPHSVIVRDDLGRPGDEYWHRAHAARVAADGTFEVRVDRPTRADGHFHLLFGFPNGMTTGDGRDIVDGDRGGPAKSYRFRNGAFQFGD